MNDILFYIPFKDHALRRKFGIELSTKRLMEKDILTGKHPVVKSRPTLWMNYMLGITMLVAFVWNMSAKAC